MTDQHFFPVDNAIIMAAGFGSRFVPLSYSCPKGLLEVRGEVMIERQIKQLHEAGIRDITIVVGYLNEMFEYLTDKYGVALVYNPEYAKKNNLASLYTVRDRLKNTYVLSSDHWMKENIFHPQEALSWYCSVKMEGHTGEWCLKLDRQGFIKKIEKGGKDSWAMYGPVFFSHSFSERMKELLEYYYHQSGTEDWYWEDILLHHLKELPMYCNKQSAQTVYEFESLDELRQFDDSYVKNARNEQISLISRVFSIPEEKIINFKPLCRGMTNRSFLFEYNSRKYVFRLPGEGSSLLVDRFQEHASYQAVAPLDIADRVVFFDAETGYKISEFCENTRNASSSNFSDVCLCMEVARRVHSASVTVAHEFVFSERIAFYESILRERAEIPFQDYQTVRPRIFELCGWFESLPVEKKLTHVDLIPDNCIISDSEWFVRLIDWEYAGMSDPLVDIAMFALYAQYDETRLEKLMQIYFQRQPSAAERLRIYAAMALGGFLWSLWSCYKHTLGQQFDDYGMVMYRYAKNYVKKWEREQINEQKIN